MIKSTVNGTDINAASARLEELLIEFQETKDPAIEAEMIRLYERSSKFKAGCSACIAGRKQFIESLKEIRAGNYAEGLLKIKTSMQSVKFKIGRLKAKFGI